MNLEVLHRAPQGPFHFPHPLLFIHGSYTAAWCWDEHFLPYFAGQGFDAYAVSLRGHGCSEGRELLKKTRLKDLLEDVRQVVKGLPGKPVLLGHSLGGGIVENYLAAYPDACSAGVLIAPAPYEGVFLSALEMIKQDPSPLWRAIRHWDLKILSHAVTRAHMIANVAPEKRAAYLARLENDEAVRAIADLEFKKVSPGKIKTPMLLLGGGDDQMVLDWQIRKVGQVFGITPHFFPGMGHEMMLEPGWQNVADTIIAWLRDLYPPEYS